MTYFIRFFSILEILKINPIDVDKKFDQLKHDMDKHP